MMLFYVFYVNKYSSNDSIYKKKRTHTITRIDIDRARDVKVSRSAWSRDHFFGLGLGLTDCFWSRPRSLEVLVFVSYALVSWSQIDFVFLKCNDF